MPRQKRKKRRSPSLSSEDVDSLDVGSLSGSEENPDAGNDPEKRRRQSGRLPRRKHMIVVEEFCVFCYGTEVCNDEGNPEELLRCSECLKYAHPSCLEIPTEAVMRAKLYKWQCNDCKGCAACRNSGNEEAIILCDSCDRGFHTFCAGLHYSPDQEANWLCPVCQGEDFEIGSNAGFSDISDSRSDKMTTWKEFKEHQSDEMNLQTEEHHLESVMPQRPRTPIFEKLCHVVVENYNNIKTSVVIDPYHVTEDLAIEETSRKTEAVKKLEFVQECVPKQIGQVSHESFPDEPDSKAQSEEVYVKTSSQKQNEEADKVSHQGLRDELEKELRNGGPYKVLNKELKEKLDESGKKSNRGSNKLNKEPNKEKSNKELNKIYYKEIDNKEWVNEEASNKESTTELVKGLNKILDKEKLDSMPNISPKEEANKESNKEESNKKLYPDLNKGAQKESNEFNDQNNISQSDGISNEEKKQSVKKKTSHAEESIILSVNQKRKRGPLLRRSSRIPETAVSQHENNVKESSENSEKNVAVGIQFVETKEAEIKEVDMKEAEVKEAKIKEAEIKEAVILRNRQARGRRMLSVNCKKTEEIIIQSKDRKSEVDIEGNERSLRGGRGRRPSKVNKESEIPINEFEGKKTTHGKHVIGSACSTNVKSEDSDALKKDQITIKTSFVGEMELEGKGNEGGGRNIRQSIYRGKDSGRTRSSMDEKTDLLMAAKILHQEFENEQCLDPNLDRPKKRGRGRPPRKEKVSDSKNVEDNVFKEVNSTKNDLADPKNNTETLSADNNMTESKKENQHKIFRRRSIRYQQSFDTVEQKVDRDENESSKEVMLSTTNTNEPCTPNIKSKTESKERENKEKETKERGCRRLSKCESFLLVKTVDELIGNEAMDFPSKEKVENLFLSENETEKTSEQTATSKRTGKRGRGMSSNTEKTEDIISEGIVISKKTSTKETGQNKEKSLTQPTKCLRNQKQTENLSKESENSDVVINKEGLDSQETDDIDLKTLEIEGESPLNSDRKSYPMRERKSLKPLGKDETIDSVEANVLINTTPKRNDDSKTPSKKQKQDTSDKDRDNDKVSDTPKRKQKIEKDVNISDTKKGKKTPNKTTTSRTPTKDKTNDSKDKDNETPKKQNIIMPKITEKGTLALKRKRETPSPELSKKKSKTDQEIDIENNSKNSLNCKIDSERENTKTKKAGRKQLTDIDTQDTDGEAASVSSSRKDCSIPPSKQDDHTCISGDEINIARKDITEMNDGVVSSADLALFKEAQAKVEEMMDSNKENLEEIKGSKMVEFGQYEIDIWYPSPYPLEYSRLAKLFVCEFCLKYMKSATILRRHLAKCCWRHPPGDEIYRKDDLSVFEVDGEKKKTYCQNLCLFAKLFLDHKTLYYEVEPFLFYVMTRADCYGCHLIGYFSKEKTSFLNYNVSCILVLPHYMKKGYGKMLIDFSYLLSRVEGKLGSPERPLSDLGLISYRSYWKDIILKNLSGHGDDCISVKDISVKTGVHSNDLISTLQALGLLKYYKGKHIILLQQDMIQSYLEKKKYRENMQLEIYPEYLKWMPKEYGQSRSRTKNK